MRRKRQGQGLFRLKGQQSISIPITLWAYLQGTQQSRQVLKADHLRSRARSPIVAVAELRALANKLLIRSHAYRGGWYIPHIRLPEFSTLLGVVLELCVRRTTVLDFGHGLSEQTSHDYQPVKQRKTTPTPRSKSVSCMYIYIYIYQYISFYIYIYLSLLYLYIYIHMHVHIHMHTCSCMCVYMYTITLQ